MRRLSLAGVLLLIGLGCADPLGRQPLSGSVTLQGQPLDQGSILFLPVSPEQTYSTGAVIQNGTFTVPREKGLVPGFYKVQISSQEETGKIIPGGPGIPPRPVMRERIPKSHTAEGKTTIEVTAGGKNHFEFGLE